MSQSVQQYSPEFDFDFERIVLHALNSTSVFSEPKSGEFYLRNIAEAVDARFLSLKVNFTCQLPEAIWFLVLMCLQDTASIRKIPHP